MFQIADVTDYRCRRSQYLWPFSQVISEHNSGALLKECAIGLVLFRKSTKTTSKNSLGKREGGNSKLPWKADPNDRAAYLQQAKVASRSWADPTGLSTSSPLKASSPYPCKNYIGRRGKTGTTRPDFTLPPLMTRNVMKTT